MAHNPYLLENFQAFMAESGDAQLSAIMTLAHVQSEQLHVLLQIADSLEAISIDATAARVDKQNFDRIFNQEVKG